ncbi:MAG: transglutaminase domain-containing protein [Eubacterium sp.]|nr:transglutaminase domain-containing protein [Eubacterium sp.]
MLKAVKRLVTVVMILGLVLTGPSVAFAAQTASNLTELAKIVNKEGMKRSDKIVVNYTGPEKDIDYVITDEDFSFFTSDIAIEDDPTTSDDADYLAGNLNFSVDKYDMYAEGQKLVIKPLYYETLVQTQYVNERVPEILDELNVAEMSNYEKVRVIHDYVCDMITWTDNGKDIVSTMYGALKNGKALCNSYALCMYKLLVEAGVPCKYVGGLAGSGRDSDGHAWNIVALGDHWYYLDATWDDPEDERTYNYFLKGSADFDLADPSEKHTLLKPYSTGKFAKMFPIARNAFNPTMMSDVNNTITIGSTGADTADDPEDPEQDVTYSIDDIVEGTWPYSGKFTVKKGKKQDIQLFLNKGMDSVIKKVSYKFTAGKAKVKSVKNYGVNIDEEDGSPYIAFTFKGKKKGKVKMKVTLQLTNGQKLSVVFSGKVK